MVVLQAMLSNLALERHLESSNQCLQSDLSEVQFQTGKFDWLIHDKDHRRTNTSISISTFVVADVI